MTTLSISKLRKEFDGFVALNDLSIDVKDGELIALLGPSGCGKTTTLRILAGLETPTQGEVLFNNKDVSHVPVEDRNIGMVFQRYALFPHMTVEKNITFGLRMRNIDKAEIEIRLKNILEVVKLDHLRQRFPSQLSGGQMQRVAIARTLITNPSLLLMDEPLANLDTKLRGEMRTFIKSLQQELSITTVFVTHDQIEAMELADRIGILFDGNLLQFDTPINIFNKPATPEIADFMGVTNFFKANIISQQGSTLLETDFGELEIAADLGSHHGKQVEVCIRAEHISLFTSKDDIPNELQKNVLEAQIETVEFFGSTFSYKISLGEAKLEVSELSNRTLKENDSVFVSLPPEFVWAFQSTIK